MSYFVKRILKKKAHVSKSWFHQIAGANKIFKDMIWFNVVQIYDFAEAVPGYMC